MHIFELVGQCKHCNTAGLQLDYRYCNLEEIREIISLDKKGKEIDGIQAVIIILKCYIEWTYMQTHPS